MQPSFQLSVSRLSSSVLALRKTRILFLLEFSPLFPGGRASVCRGADPAGARHDAAGARGRRHPEPLVPAPRLQRAEGHVPGTGPARCAAVHLLRHPPSHHPARQAAVGGASLRGAGEPLGFSAYVRVYVYATGEPLGLCYG